MTDRLQNVDGILAIHLSMGVQEILAELLKLKRPVLLFAAPYSGHEWTSFGSLRNQEAGALLECVLSSDFDDLAVAVRPFRRGYNYLNRAWLPGCFILKRPSTMQLVKGHRHVRSAALWRNNHRSKNC